MRGRRRWAVGQAGEGRAEAAVEGAERRVVGRVRGERAMRGVKWSTEDCWAMTVA